MLLLQVLSVGLQCQLKDLKATLSSNSASLPQVKRAFSVTALAELSWLVPRMPILLQCVRAEMPSAPVDASVFCPFMLQLPKVRVAGVCLVSVTAAQHSSQWQEWCH
jgi:hypothetical protein